MKVVALDTDGSIRRQELSRNFAIETVDLTSVRSDLQFYAGARGRSAFRRATGHASRTRSIFLLGSGDFHHLTLLWLQTMTAPYFLVIFDNHFDCSAIGPKYHCGNWLYHAARLEFCRRILHCGATERPGIGATWFGTDYLRSKGKWTAMSGRDLGTAGGVQQFADTLAVENPTRLPIYVSIDKDVLSPEYAPGDWDNGQLAVADLRAMVTDLFRAYVLCGADITGEKGGSFHYAKRPLKNVLSSIEHRVCRDATPLPLSMERQRAVNIELLNALGADRVG